MRGMIKERLALPAIVLVLMSGLVCSTWFIAGMHPDLKGSVRPALKLLSLHGVPTMLPSPFFGRHVILLFTPSCPHCKRVLEQYSRLALLAPHVPVYGISLGDAALTDSLVRAKHFSFPVLLDREGSVQILFRVDRVPVVLYVDEEDVIRLVLMGSRRYQEDSILFSRFGRPGAPGAPDVGSQEGTGIRKSPDAPPAIMADNDAPTACLAVGMGSRLGPVGPRSSDGVPGPSGGPRQAAGSYAQQLISFHEKEELSCVPG